MYKETKKPKADTLMILDSLCFVCLNNEVFPSALDELTPSECVIQGCSSSPSFPDGQGSFCSSHPRVLLLLLLLSHCLVSLERYLDFSSEGSEELAGFRITAEIVTKG